MRASETKPEAESGTEMAFVRAAKDGDVAAFEELVRRHTDRVFRIARHIALCHEDAEEVVQDTFLRVFRNLNRFEERSRFSTWLTRIAINTALMKVRGRHRHETVSIREEGNDESLVSEPLVDWRPNPEQLYRRSELRAILTEILESLSTTRRTVFLLRDVEGLSTAETAEVLGVSITAVKSVLLRTRLQLRERLDKYFQDRSNANETVYPMVANKPVSAAVF